MLTSTLFDQIVTPAPFYKFGKKVFERKTGTGMAERALERWADEMFPTDVPEEAMPASVSTRDVGSETGTVSARALVAEEGPTHPRATETNQIVD